jgi:hypothetical protein
MPVETRRGVGVGVAACYLALLLLSACGSLPQSSSPVHPSSDLTTPGTSPGAKPTAAGSATIIDQVGPPPVVLEDTSPDQLAAQVHLTIGGYDPATQNLAELSIVFLHQGRWVQFVRGERLSCNGITLPGPGTAFDLKVPADTIGGKQIACTYTSRARSATLVFTAPPTPTILSPADGSQIGRSHATLVRFRVGGQNTMFYITALGPGTKSWVFPAGDPPTRGTGNPPTQATLDTSALSAGSGSITLVQSFTLADIRGAGFQHVDGNGEGFQVESVTWA